MNVPWVRHLRRSPGVRSLNFFQGMPLVSARGGVSSWDLEGFCASPSPDMRPGEAVYCRTFPFDFPSSFIPSGACGSDGREPMQGRTAMHGRGGATLLTVTLRLHSGFRFGLDRHKSATAARGKACLRPGENSEPLIPPACRSVEQGMTHFHILRRGPNWPTIGALHHASASANVGFDI